MALHFQVVHPSVNKFCMSWYLFIYWNDFNETSTNICHGKKWKGYQSMGSRSRSLGIHLPNLNLMSFSTHVSVSVCVQICEWYVVEAYILTVWSTLTSFEISILNRYIFFCYLGRHLLNYCLPVWNWQSWFYLFINLGNNCCTTRCHCYLLLSLCAT